MSLTVITHTRYTRPEWLDRCERSVAQALPPGACHKIIPGFDNWAKGRLDAALSDEFVAFVDDDDTIDPQALKLCLDALQQSNAGVACTNEVTVNPDLSVIEVHNGRKTYNGIRLLPRALHHLCVIRSSAVDPKALDIHNKFGMGIDWFIRAGAALRYDAIHVPYEGYFWTRHPDSKIMQQGREFNRCIPAMTEQIHLLWPKRIGPLPIYQFNGVSKDI